MFMNHEHRLGCQNLVLAVWRVVGLFGSILRTPFAHGHGETLLEEVLQVVRVAVAATDGDFGDSEVGFA